MFLGIENLGIDKPNGDLDRELFLNEVYELSRLFKLL